MEKNSIKISDDVMTTLKKMAKEEGFSVGEIIGRAIGLEKYCSDVERHGGKLLVEKKTGEFFRIVRGNPGDNA